MAAHTSIRIHFNMENIVTYTNWKGETSERKIIPYYIWYGCNEWHPEPQWMVECYDVNKGEYRSFALNGIGLNLPIKPQPEPTTPAH